MRVTPADWVLGGSDQESRPHSPRPLPSLSVRPSGGMLSAADLTVPNGAGGSPVGE